MPLHLICVNKFLFLEWKDNLLTFDIAVFEFMYNPQYSYLIYKQLSNNLIHLNKEPGVPVVFFNLQNFIMLILMILRMSLIC